MQKQDFEEVKKHISILNIAYQLNLEILDEKGCELKVVCPFCGYKSKTKTADMSLNCNKNSYHCFKCGKSGFAIGLYATLRKLDNKTAFKELVEKEAFSCDRSELVIDTNNKLADLTYRDMVYREFLNMIKLSTEHKRKLERLGLSKSYIDDYLFKSIPTKKFSDIVICHYLSKKYNLAGVPGFYQREDFKWTFSKLHGIFVPVFSSSAKIKGLSILLDEKYNGTYNIWFSSSNKLNGTASESWLTSFNIKYDTDTIILTDNLITAHNLRIGLNVPIIAFSSIQNSRNIIRKLQNTNIKNIIFTLRVKDETQKLDYLIEKLISGLLAVGYNVIIKTFKEPEDMYRPDILELFNQKTA